MDITCSWRLFSPSVTLFLSHLLFFLVPSWSPWENSFSLTFCCNFCLVTGWKTIKPTNDEWNPLKWWTKINQMNQMNQNKPFLLFLLRHLITMVQIWVTLSDTLSIWFINPIFVLYFTSILVEKAISLLFKYILKGKVNVHMHMYHFIKIQ